MTLDYLELVVTSMIRGAIAAGAGVMGCSANSGGSASRQMIRRSLHQVQLAPQWYGSAVCSLVGSGAA